MVTCTYCSKELDRNIFCDSKCKLKHFRSAVKPVALRKFKVGCPEHGSKQHEERGWCFEKK